MKSKVIIYIEADILRRLARRINNDQFENLSQIFKTHATVCLDMSEEEYNRVFMPKEESLNGPQDILYNTFTKGDYPKFAKRREFFEEIKKDINILKTQRNEIFILSIDKNRACRFREEYGIEVYSEDEVNNSMFRFRFMKTFNQQPKIPSKYSGWIDTFKELKTPMPVYNSLIVSDNHLLDNKGYNKEIADNVYFGFENLYEIFKLVLPKSLDYPFYILVVCPPIRNNEQKTKVVVEEWSERVKKLRNYELVVEVLTTTKTIHDRYIFTNYFMFELGKGFHVFLPNSTRLCKYEQNSPNKISIESYLHDPFGGGESNQKIGHNMIDIISNIYRTFMRRTGETNMYSHVEVTHLEKNPLLSKKVLKNGLNESTNNSY